MRILFGVLGLLIVVAIVLGVARTQLQSVGLLPAGSSASAGQDESASREAVGPLDTTSGASEAHPDGMTVRQRSQSLQNQVATDVRQIMQNAPARAEGQ